MAIIILSHVASDGEIVERMREKLAARGHRVIGSRDSPQDTSWARSFSRLLYDADHVVNVMSQDALGNAQMTVVARLAARLEKGVDVWGGTDDPPAQLSQALNLGRWRGDDADAAWTQLLARLGDDADVEEPAPFAPPPAPPRPAESRFDSGFAREPEPEPEPEPEAASDLPPSEPSAPAPPDETWDEPAVRRSPETTALAPSPRAFGAEPSSEERDQPAPAAEDDTDAESGEVVLHVQSDISADLSSDISVAYDSDTVSRAWGDILSVSPDASTDRPGVGPVPDSRPVRDNGAAYADDGDRDVRDPDPTADDEDAGPDADAPARLYPDDLDRWRMAQAATGRTAASVDEDPEPDDGERRPRLRRIMVRGPEETPAPSEERAKVALEEETNPEGRVRVSRSRGGMLGLVPVAAVVGYAVLAAIGFSYGYVTKHREAREAEVAWIAAQETNTVRDFRVWLQRYGDGPRADTVRAALATLEVARAETQERQRAALRRVARTVRPGRTLDLVRLTAAAALTERAPDAPDMTDPFDRPPDRAAFTPAGEDPSLVNARRAVRRATRAVLTGNRLAMEIWTAEVAAAVRAWDGRT